MALVRFVAYMGMALAMWALPQGNAWAGTAEASKYIEKLAGQTLDTIADGGLSKEKKQAALEKLFSNNVDIPWVGRFVMGRFWRQANDDQKKRYLERYQTFIIRHYTKRFTDYTSGTFKIVGAKEDSGGEYTVSMSLQTAEKGSDPINVDYRVRQMAGGFKIFDITVEGVSMITTQRSEFSEVISNHDIEYLIKQLENKSAFSE